MEMSKEEIIDLAQRYISPQEIYDFPYNGDLFCLLIRPVPTDRVLTEEEGWVFNGYGICINYAYDEEAKPRGKWLWMHFASLAAFPPVAQVLKLQPPHIIKGRFQSYDRTHEIRIIKVGVNAADKTTAQQSPAGIASERPKHKKASTASATGKNIVAFRTKKSP